MPGHLRAADAPEDLWTCHECGWTYPNHHPSAKHRRNHKKVCGSIPGFTDAISSRNAPLEGTPSITDGASSDDASSDDETTPEKSAHGKHGHNHTTPPALQQTLGAATGGTRAAKSLCVTHHRSKDPYEEAHMKPAPLTERAFSDQNNRQALHSTASTPNAPVKPQHVRRRSAHALEGVWVCRHCGWTYPNPHPSAKHRRKHKKKCPALVVTPRHVVGAGGSSDDASSDEENKRGDAAPQQHEAVEMNLSFNPSPLPTALEAFLGRSDSKRELRELPDTIILLSPKPMSRKGSFKSPGQRKEGPGGFLSPRGSMKSRAGNNNQAAQELVVGTERTPEAVSDQENEEPVVLYLPAARILTPQSVPAPENGSVGETLPDGRRSSSDESDLNNSDEGTPSSPDSVLQPVHLLLPSTNSTPSDVTDEEVAEQSSHQQTAVITSELDVETERDDSTSEVAVKQDQQGTAPELQPLTAKASTEVDTSESCLGEGAASADEKVYREVYSVHSCKPVEASPCAELQTALTGATFVAAEETELATGADVEFKFSGWKYVASSLVVKPALKTAVKDHMQLPDLDSDVAPEHVSDEALVVGGSSNETSVENEHHDVQDTNEGQLLSEHESVSINATEDFIERQSCEGLDSSEIVTTGTVVTDTKITLDNESSSSESTLEMSRAIKSPEDGGKAGNSELGYASPLHKRGLQESSDRGGSASAVGSPEVLPADLSTVEASVAIVKGDEEKETQPESSVVRSADQLPEEVPFDSIKEDHGRDLKTSSVADSSPNQAVHVTVETAEEKVDGDPEFIDEAFKEDTSIHSSSSADLPFNGPSVEVSVKGKDNDPQLITYELSSTLQSPRKCISDGDDKNLSVLSSDGPFADQLSVDNSGEVLGDKKKDHVASHTQAPAPTESLLDSISYSTLLSEVEENTETLLGTVTAAEVQPTSIDRLELSSEPTTIVTLVPAAIYSLISPDAAVRDDSTSLSASEKVEEPLSVEPKFGETPSTAMRTSELNFETLPTPESQVVVTEPVGYEDQEANKSDNHESENTDDVEEKTTSPVAIDSHLSVGKEELLEASHHAVAEEEEECKDVHGSSVAEESKDRVSANADKNHKQVKGASGFSAEKRFQNPEATSTLDSAYVAIEDQVAIEEVKSDLYTVSNMEQQEVLPAVAEVCVVNTKDQIVELNEKGTAEEKIKVLAVAEPTTIKSEDVVAEDVYKKVDDFKMEVHVVTDAKETPASDEAVIPQNENGGSKSGVTVHDMHENIRSSSVTSNKIVTTGAAGSGREVQQKDAAVCGKQAPTVTLLQVPEVKEKQKSPAKPAGLFGQYRDKFNKLQREPSLKAREPQPAMTRQPGSGKRKLLPSICGTSDEAPVLKNKKQEPRPAKDRGRGVQSDSDVPLKLKFTRRSTRCPPAQSPPLSPQRAGGPASPEGLVKERIETYERLIGKTRTFGSVPAPSPTYHKSSGPSGRSASPHISGQTLVTCNHQLEREQYEASAAGQISAVATHLHHKEATDKTKVQDTENAPAELLHEALSHLRRNNNDNRQDSSTEPEDSSSQRISKVPSALKEAAEHCLSPVARLTKAY